MLSRPFCLEHGRSHGEKFQHQISTKDGTYLGDDGPGQKDTKKVLVSLEGWRYTDLAQEHLIESGLWFPMTPSRSTVFVHLYFDDSYKAWRYAE